MRTIYLDYNASTPADARVVERMLPYFTERAANASSTDHGPGSEARRAVEIARDQIAKLIGAEAEEITFTSGATESNNIAVLGAMQRAPADAELVVSSVEHPAVLEPAQRFGDRLKLIPVDGSGIVHPEALRKTITPRTALVCVMAANNETGAVNPLAEIGAVCREAGVPLHVDAVQAAARMPLSVDALNASSVAISGHKMYGPKGVGALFVRRRPPRAKLAPITYGGGHERNLRPGTLNVPGIVGFGEAAAIVRSEGEADWVRERRMRDAFIAELRTSTPVEVLLNSADDACLSQTINLRFAGISAAGILHAISDRVAIATGSACSTTSVEPSHVLLAQGLSRKEVAESLRISFGRQTPEADLQAVIPILSRVVSELSSVGTVASAA